METRDVTLPSGLKVTIKKPGVLALKAIFGVLPAVGGGLAQAAPNRIESLDTQIAMVCGCCVAPRFHRDYTAPDGFQSVDELTLEDWNALSGAVAEFSNLGEAEKTLDPSSTTPPPL